MLSANFSTGPVALSPAVRAALAAPPISHRSAEFVSLLAETREQLRSLVRAKHIGIFCGSGTLANEVVAQQLKRLPGRGLILVNGEFGERLQGLAQRAALALDVVAFPWGHAFDLARVRETLSARNDYAWIWTVATETSTGVANEIAALKSVAREFGLRLCLDCMSAIGVVPLDLSDVYLASASSGKGLASIAGLALVFAQASGRACASGPASLDLALHSNEESVAFTLPSPLLAALNASLCELTTDSVARYARIARHDRWLRQTLAPEFEIVGEHASESGVITFALPDRIGSQRLGERLRKRGMEIGFESAYLRERGWLQCALMGRYSELALRRLPMLLRSECAELRSRSLNDTPTALPHFSLREQFARDST
jgi:aspartate aminotransferase-like enzyme